MGQYSYSQPFSSSINSVPSLPSHPQNHLLPIHQSRLADIGSRDYNYGVPVKCICGGNIIRGRRTLGKGFGSLFFECENAGTGGVHTSKWRDKAILEEIHRIKSRCAEHGDEMMNYLTYSANGERCDPRTVLTRVTGIEEQINNLQEMVHELNSGYTDFRAFLQGFPTDPITTRKLCKYTVIAYAFLGLLYLLLAFALAINNFG